MLSLSPSRLIQSLPNTPNSNLLIPSATSCDNELIYKLVNAILPTPLITEAVSSQPVPLIKRYFNCVFQKVMRLTTSSTNLRDLAMHVTLTERNLHLGQPASRSPRLEVTSTSTSSDSIWSSTCKDSSLGIRQRTEAVIRMEARMVFYAGLIFKQSETDVYDSEISLINARRVLVLTVTLQSFRFCVRCVLSWAFEGTGEERFSRRVFFDLRIIEATKTIKQFKERATSSKEWTYNEGFKQSEIEGGGEEARMGRKQNPRHIMFVRRPSGLLRERWWWGALPPRRLRRQPAACSVLHHS